MQFTLAAYLQAWGGVLQQHYFFVASLTTAPQLVLLFQ